MKQQKAIEAIAGVLRGDPAVRALFLKGSLARGEGDAYSDVDFYCLVHADQMPEFLQKRTGYLEQYRPLLFQSEANFVGPQIVAVFDDGLHFDLYTVTLETLPKTDEIKVLYDPEGLLATYVAQPLTLDATEVIRCLHEFTFSLLEFEAAYKRGDLLWASRLASHLSGNLSVVLRFLYDPEHGKLGCKRLHRYLEKGEYDHLKLALDLLGPSYLPKGVQLLVELAETILKRLPEEMTAQVNLNFFREMANKIRHLS